MLKKRIQRALLVFLLLGTVFLYHRAFVTVDARILALESALPLAPAPFEVLQKEGDASNTLESGIFEPGILEPETLENEWEQVSSLFNVAIPETPGIPGVLGGIARQARLLGIQGVTMETAERQPAETLSAIPLFTWPIRLRFMSEYVQLAQFVHALQGMARIAEILEVSMKRYPPGLATEISLAVYSQTAPVLITPSKKEGKKKRSGMEETLEDDFDTFDEMAEDEGDDFGEDSMMEEMEPDDYVAE